MQSIGLAKTRYTLASIALRNVAITHQFPSNLDELVQLDGSGIDGYSSLEEFWIEFVRRTISRNDFIEILAGALLASGCTAPLPLSMFISQALDDAEGDGESFIWSSNIPEGDKRVHVGNAVQWLLDHPDYSDRVPKSLRLAAGRTKEDARLFSKVIEHEATRQTQSDLETAPIARRRGPKPEVFKRVVDAMRAFEKAALATMTEVAMEEQFKASRDTCRRAREAVLSELQGK